MPHAIRLLTYNAWHALDWRHPRLMLPQQSPAALVRRAWAQGTEIRRLLSPDPRVLDFVCLQELNPAPLRVAELRARTGLRGRALPVNVGVRAGALGWPPALHEGLGLLHSRALESPHWDERTLSGDTRQWRLPLGTTLSLQTAERRSALGVLGRADGLRIAAVCVHLHHLSTPEGARRRADEVARLAAWLTELQARADLVFVAGDFNCNPDAPELAPLAALGFTCPPSLVSWDPRENSILRRHPDPLDAPMRLDRAYHWMRAGEGAPRRPQIEVRRVLDGPEALSDHFGVLTEYRW
jgi:endonuclease/exonuclease/phosphatase family metal-dependent hydrolase